MRSATIRALRTFAQTLAGALVALPTVDVVSDLRGIANPLIVALWTAFLAGLVSLLHNLAEDATGNTSFKG